MNQNKNIEEKIPTNWEPVYSQSISAGDFIGDAPIQTGILIGWLTPDGFVSPDKLPEEYKPKCPEREILRQKPPKSAQNLPSGKSEQPCPECIRLGDLAEEWAGKCRAQEVRAEKAELKLAAEKAAREGFEKGVMAGAEIKYQSQITTLQAEIAEYREVLEPLVEFMESECYDWAIVKNARKTLSNNHTSKILALKSLVMAWIENKESLDSADVVLFDGIRSLEALKQERGE